MYFQWESRTCKQLVSLVSHLSKKYYLRSWRNEWEIKKKTWRKKEFCSEINKWNESCHVEYADNNFKTRVFIGINRIPRLADSALPPICRSNGIGERKLQILQNILTPINSKRQSCGGTGKYYINKGPDSQR